MIFSTRMKVKVKNRSRVLNRGRVKYNYIQTTTKLSKKPRYLLIQKPVTNSADTCPLEDMMDLGNVTQFLS